MTFFSEITPLILPQSGGDWRRLLSGATGRPRYASANAMQIALTAAASRSIVSGS
jgi:hypothetical protein